MYKVVRVAGRQKQTRGDWRTTAEALYNEAKKVACPGQRIPKAFITGCQTLGDGMYHVQFGWWDGREQIVHEPPVRVALIETEERPPAPPRRRSYR